MTGGAALNAVPLAAAPLALGLEVQGIADGMPAKFGPVGATVNRSILFSQAQLEAKFASHAADFGVTLPRGRAGFVAFRDALQSHLDDAATIAIPGTYRWSSEVTHFYNPNTGLDPYLQRAIDVVFTATDDANSPLHGRSLESEEDVLRHDVSVVLSVIDGVETSSR